MLNDKQTRFCEEYIIDLNATQAAIRAEYSERTAYSQGQRLLKNVEAQELITELKASRSERTKIDADWLLKRLAEEAEADVADLYSENGGLLPVNQWPEIWRKGLVAGIDTHQEYTFEGGEKIPDGVTVKIRLSERIKRLELIGKHVDVQAFKEKIEHLGVVTNNIMVLPGCTNIDDWEAKAKEHQGSE
ncbi:MAG: terminase [Alphaproteobacteria bacterium]|nr:MAG: terminase [Alphaproteobacteria bacterium]